MPKDEVKPAGGAFLLKPVGMIKSEIKAPSLKAEADGINLQGDFEKLKERSRNRSSRVSEIVINDDLEGILDGIEDFSHILVLYWAHQASEESRGLKKVHPMGRKENPLTGVFATCSPARPNPVLMTAVKLLAREGNVLRVQGLDAIDGSPVIDVKPYVPSYQVSDEVKVPWWMEKILREFSNK
jgi:tRNA-Thr(GGU) m(6)t(6)A37 methyltransferase TsaA